MKSKNILVLGSNGQLGQEFYRLSKEIESSFLFYDFPQIDIVDLKSIEKIFLKNKIFAVINCAAYTNVSLAESEKIKCSDVNTKGVKNIVKICEKFSSKLIHFSTDYVYNSNTKKPICEDSNIDPQNHYGFSKRMGEVYIENSKIESIILRTSWLYSKFGNNFVNTIIKKAKSQPKIDIVDDEFGTPTFAKDLAEASIKILESEKRIDRKGKIYNYSNLGMTNWFNFAKQIVKLSSLKCKVNPISSSKFQTEVMRPKYSVMSKNKFINDYKIKINHWKDSLNYYINLDLR